MAYGGSCAAVGKGTIYHSKLRRGLAVVQVVGINV